MRARPQKGQRVQDGATNRGEVVVVFSSMQECWVRWDDRSLAPCWVPWHELEEEQRGK